MRVLLDECVPRALRHELADHDVKTVAVGRNSGAKRRVFRHLGAIRSLRSLLRPTGWIGESLERCANGARDDKRRLIERRIARGERRQAHAGKDLTGTVVDRRSGRDRRAK